MIAILVGSRCFVRGTNDIKDFLIEYTEYIGFNTKVFKILTKSEDFTVNDLIDYINENCYDIDDKIVEIYTLGDKLY